MRGAATLAVALGVGLAYPQPADEAVVRVEQPAVAWQCRWTDGTALEPARTGTGLEWRWPCRTGVWVRCDAPHREPRDIGAESCGTTVDLPDAGARVARLRRQDARPVRVEWREPASDWQLPTRLLAAREFGRGELLLLAVSMAGRVLRIVRPDAAPVSLWVPPGASEVAREVSSAEAGGELVLMGYRRAGTVPMAEYDGRATGRVLLSTADPITRATVWPGDYDVRLVFASGIRSAPLHVRIEAGESTEVPLDSFPPTGAARLVIDESLLEEHVLSAEIVRFVRDGGSTLRSRVWGDPVLPAGARLIDGLPPGEYELLLRAAGKVVGGATFAVQADEIAQVLVERPSVQVVGSVSLGGAPAPEGSRLQFAIGEQVFDTTTDAAGRYAVTLGAPGRYTARLVSASYLWPRSQSVDLVAGVNRFDWRMPGGALRLAVRREDGGRLDEIVQIVCRGSGPDFAGPATPEELESPLVIGGLSLGEATCTARTRSGLVSSGVRTSLTVDRPLADVTLTLRWLPAELVVRGAHGAPLPGAAVIVDNRSLPEDPPLSGRYRLTGSAPGATMLIVAPDHLPLCRTLREHDFPAAEVTLHPAGGIAATIRLTPIATRPPGLVYGLPGSECPVRLSELGPELRQSGDTTEITLRLPPGVYRYQPYLTFPPQTLVVPGPPLELKRP